MICPICKTRWADFPEKAFKFVGPHGKIKMFFSRITFNLIKRNGFYPKHDEAGFNRGVAYGSNNIVHCQSPGCLEIAAGISSSVDIKFLHNQIVQTKEMIEKGKI